MAIPPRERDDLVVARVLPASELLQRLARIDGRGYKAYKSIAGEYDFGDFRLIIDHVQGDPYAAPTSVRAVLEPEVAGFPGKLYANRSRRIALEDYLNRAFLRAISRFVKGHRGSGKSGMVAILPCGQEILERTSVRVSGGRVEFRFVVGLPARGRTVLGREAQVMFSEEIPKVVKAAGCYRNLDTAAVERHVATAEDQDALREMLPGMGLVAFIGDGSILPRRSGVSDEPMNRDRAVPFRSPPSLRVRVCLPNRGEVTGMGIPFGVTLIVGGGYHGKSTLLRALERGVYNHIPGDGRELVCTLAETVKIRAEDGRRVEKVDITPFIQNLPQGQDTTCFSTEEASGSTSQAANIMEALEMGAKVLCLDEDTSATNFMIRDVRMQHLVAKEKEPITPFIDKVRQLVTEKGVSVILVMGGSGDYFDVADTVIMMDEYVPYDVTQQAREVAERFRTGRKEEGGGRFGRVTPRIPLPHSIDARRGSKVKITPRTEERLQFGREEIQLAYVEQLVDVAQTRAIGDMIHLAQARYFDGRKTMAEALTQLMRDIDRHGLDMIAPPGRIRGDYARPRIFELAAAVNRLRTLKVRQLPRRDS